MSEPRDKSKVNKTNAGATPVAGMLDNVLFVDSQPIHPGEQSVIGIRVGSLPSDTRIYINIFVYRSENPGPVVLVLAGMHGDEVNGVEIIQKAIEDRVFEHVKAGTVVAIPLLNVYGFIHFSRDLPDGKDVNRSFPGNRRGSLASRMAYVLSKRVLPAVNYVIDLHTGGASRYNYPQIRITPSSAESLHLARSFGVRFILKKGIIRRSLRKVAGDMGIPIIVYEGGEALRTDGLSMEKGLKGIINCLKSLGVLDGEIAVPKEPMLLIEKSSWVRASTSGLFKWSVESGMPVGKGQVLGIITDPYNSKHTRVVAPRSGFIIGHNNTPVVNLGDALFAIGYQHQELSVDE